MTTLCVVFLLCDQHLLFRGPPVFTCEFNLNSQWQVEHNSCVFVALSQAFLCLQDYATKVGKAWPWSINDDILDMVWDVILNLHLLVHATDSLSFALGHRRCT